MSDTNDNSAAIAPQAPALSLEDSAAKTGALIAYGLMAVGLFTGLLFIIGAIWAMIKKGDAQGTLFEDHYSAITRTFWYSLLFTIIGIITAPFVVGYFIMAIAWVWTVYRIVKGIARITSNRPFYN